MLESKYYTEVPEKVASYILLAETLSLTEVANTHKVSKNDVVNCLNYFGFGKSTAVIRANLKRYRKEGTLEQYLKGDFNIDKVELLEDEVLVPLNGFHGYYISNYGRVISYKCFTKQVLCKLTIPYASTSLTVKLVDKGKLKVKTVKYLVAEHFLPNPLNLTKVVCYDGDPYNLKVDNLMFVDDSVFYDLTRGRFKRMKPVDYFSQLINA